MKTNFNNKTICVVGLGYVGLPLAVEFGKKLNTIGFDISVEKINNFKDNYDPTGEIYSNDFILAKNLVFTADATEIQKADIIIIAVPTPVDIAHKPDFQPLISASQLVGNNLKENAVIIYESTVYPGATEEICVPVLEKSSNKKWKKDFHVGYSPERINPGDKIHRLQTITKVVSGDDENTLLLIAELYKIVVSAGVHLASNIKVAEAAKVIENTQRDLNIALMNELAILFNKLDIDTTEVLEAAGTKWNFLHFRPGLVGGHCIGVDPYYLTHKAEMVGYNPQVILSGRRINDSMGKYIAEQTVKEMLKADLNIRHATINILGLTFKENCPDLRNSRVIDVINELNSYGISVNVHDPIADQVEALAEYGVKIIPFDELPKAEALIIAVAHNQFLNITNHLSSILVDNGCLIDVKAMFKYNDIKALGYNFWRL